MLRQLHKLPQQPSSLSETESAHEVEPEMASYSLQLHMFRVRIGLTWESHVSTMHMKEEITVLGTPMIKLNN